jgi:hypothetical protein
LVLLADQLLQPSSLGLQASSYDLTASTSGMDVSAFAGGALAVSPTLGSLSIPAANIPLRIAATGLSPQPASQGMWVLPPGTLLLQTDAAENSQAGLAGVVCLQQLQQQYQGLGASSSTGAATGAAGAAGAGANTGAAGAALPGVAAGQLVLLQLPDAAGQADGLFQLQQGGGGAAEGVRLLQAQQLQQLQQVPQPPDASTSLFEHQ